MDAATASMLRLNRTASEILTNGTIHACTDVTGFALLGHALEIAQKSHVRLRIHANRLEFLPGAEELATMWLFPAGTGNNHRAYASRIAFDPAVPEELQHLLLTPETSGGLLAAVPPERLHDLKEGFAAAGEPLWVIGEVMEKEEGHSIEVVP